MSASSKILLTRNFLKNIFRIIVAVVFLYSAYGKSVDPEPTKLFLASISWFPISFSSIAITILIISEVGLALMLLIPKTQTIGSHSSVAVLLVFTLVLLFQSTGETGVDCGCFGSIGADLGVEFSIIRNIILILMLSITVELHTSN